MPDLATLIDPAHTALVTQECQNGVIGARSVLPALAEAARASVIPNTARLVAAARTAQVPVVHCVAQRRADGRGSNNNARMFAGARKSEVAFIPGSEATQVVPEIGVEDSDIVLGRLHGIGPMGGTDLDAVLRNLGVTTVVGVGVSINVGMLSFCMDAVNSGYRFVMPRDAVAGLPPAYAEQVLDNTFVLLATLPSTNDVLEVWKR